MANISTIFKITAGVTGLDAVSAFQKEIKGISTSGENASRGLNLLTKAAKGFILAYGLNEIRSMVQQTINLGDEFNDLSKKTGVAVEDLASFNVTASQSGLSTETLAAGLNKLNVNIAKAASGNKEAEAAFKNLGISLTDVNGKTKTAGQILPEIADKFKGMADGATKSYEATALFGKGAGASFIPFLDEGADGITRFKSAMDSSFTENADKFNDNLQLMKANAQNLAIEVVSALLPALNSIIEGFNTTDEKGKELNTTMPLLQTALAGVGEAARGVAVGINAVATAFGQAKTVVGTGLALGAVQFTKDGKSSDILDEAGKQLQQRSDNFKAQTLVMMKDGLIAKYAQDMFKEAGGEGYLPGLITDPNAKKASKKVVDPSNIQTADKGNAAKTIQDKIDKLNAETAAMQENDAEKEISTGLAEIEAAGITKGSAAYDKFAASLTAAIMAHQQAKETKDISDWLVKQNESIASLKQEADYIGMTTVEVAKLKDARQIDSEVADKSKNMTDQGAAAYKAAAENVKELRANIMQLNYDQSRTFQAGAKTAFATYTEDAGNAAKASEKLFGDFFQNSEDAFVNWAKTGKLSFSSMIDSFIEDLLRLQVKSLASSVLGSSFGGSNGFASLFGGGGSSSLWKNPDTGSLVNTGGGIFGDAAAWIGNLFADGGIMTSKGSMPLKKYAAGGVASSPQLAMFGEGAQPEAYVPLPDGRRIPVAISKGAGGTNIAVSVTINSDGSTDITSPSQATNFGKFLANAVKAGIAKEQLPGGMLDKTRKQ